MGIGDWGLGVLGLGPRTPPKTPQTQHQKPKTT